MPANPCTHEYFKTAKYELQTPTATMFLMDILVINPQFKMSKILQKSALKKNMLIFTAVMVCITLVKIAYTSVFFAILHT